jgi:translocation protein SEC63
MILGSSFEFEKSSNTDIVERPTDNVEMPQLMRELPDLQEKIREFPFSCIYSIKARALIHAHLLRLPLPAATLQKDKNVIIKKCPFLINEMVNVVSNIFATISQNGAPKHIHPPTLETLENIMKLSPMIVQALWDKNKKYSLLQLPHIVENHLRHFVTKKRNICDIKQFVSMKDADRRSILRHLTNEQYEDILRVAGSYPLIEMDVKTKVFDDEDEQTITVGAIVTVVVNLTRKNLQVLFEKENQSDQTTNEELLNESNQEDGLIVEEVEQQQKPVVVNKQVAKSKNNNKKNKNSKQPQPQQTKQIKETESNEDDEEEDSAAEDIETIGNSSIESKSKSKPTKTSNNNNEEYFEKFQQLQKKREKLEAKTKISHRVYCPYYSDVKQECWWLYVADRKNHSIICPPTYICSLKTNEELELRFLAPKTPGTYTYSVSLRSDSYLDFDVFQNIKLDVEKAKDIEEHPQWDFSDEEANKSDNEKDDEFETESDSD